MSSASESPESELSGQETGSVSDSGSSSSDLPPPISATRSRRIIRPPPPARRSAAVIPDELRSESDATFVSPSRSDASSDSSDPSDSLSADEASTEGDVESTLTKASPKQAVPASKDSKEEDREDKEDREENDEEEEAHVTTDAKDSADTVAYVPATSSTNTARAICRWPDDVAFNGALPAINENDDDYDSDAPLIQLTQGHSSSSTAQYAKSRTIPTSLRRTPYASHAAADRPSRVCRPTSPEEHQADQPQHDRQDLRITAAPKQKAITRTTQSVLKKNNGLVRRGRPPRRPLDSIAARKQDEEVMSQPLYIRKKTEDDDISSEEVSKGCTDNKQSVLQKKMNGLGRRGRPPRRPLDSISARKQDEEVMPQALYIRKEPEDDDLSNEDVPKKCSDNKQSVPQKKMNGLGRRGRPSQGSSDNMSTGKQDQEVLSRAQQIAKEPEDNDPSCEDVPKRCASNKQSVLQKKKNGLARRGRPAQGSSDNMSVRKQDQLMSRALQLAKETEEQRKADLCSQEELDRFLQQDAGVNPLRERRAERREKLMSRGAPATKWRSHIENARLVQHVEYRNATPRHLYWRPPVKRAVCLEKCVITGLPARYRDPTTGKPFANLDAYRTLHHIRNE